jgi:antitoxin component YwqK of YwqJK toxin-antitoxin module
MKNCTFLLILILGLLAACSREHKVVEESYPDGSPKRVIIYLGKGENREMIRETTFYPNKQMQMDGAYKNSKRDGKWMYWYENGKVWSEGYFINGKSDGKRTTYFENGKVRYEGFYKEDMRVGKWRFFDESGRMLQEVDYSAPPKEGKK